MEQRDAAFVRRVMTTIARQRRIRLTRGIVLSAILPAVVGTALIVFSPFISDGANYVAQAPTLFVEPLAALLMSPVGWGISLLVAALVLRRTFVSA